MKTRASKVRYRPHPWFNTKTNRKMFGIQARVGSGEWMHMAEDGNPLIYDSEADRDAKILALRQRVGPIDYNLSLPVVGGTKP